MVKFGSPVPEIWNQKVNSIGRGCNSLTCLLVWRKKLPKPPLPILNCVKHLSASGNICKSQNENFLPFCFNLLNQDTWEITSSESESDSRIFAEKNSTVESQAAKNGELFTLLSDRTHLPGNGFKKMTSHAESCHLCWWSTDREKSLCAVRTDIDLKLPSCLE